MSSGGTSTVHKEGLPKGSPAYLCEAAKDIGIREWVLERKRRVSNPVVEHFIAQVNGQPLNARTTPWCAFWVGAKLQDAGYTSTKSGMARSYLRWGVKVGLDDAKWKPGDICIFWRGKRDDNVTGHVAFLMEWDEDFVYCLGANQGDSVNVQRFSRSKLLGVVRPRPLSASRTVKSAGGAATSEAVSVVVDKTLPSAPVAPTTPKPSLPKPEHIEQSLNQLKDPIEVLATYKPWLMLALSLVTVVCIGYAAYFRYIDYREGRG